MAVGVENRSRRQVLEDQVAQHQAARDATVARIEELRQQEAELRVAGIRAKPGQRSDSAGALSEVHKVVADRKKLEASIEGLDAEIAAAAVVLDEFRAGEDAAAFEEALAGIAEFDVAEDRIRRRLAEAHAAFFKTFDELSDCYAARREYPAQFTFTDVGQANQIRAAVRPKWT